jgi:hypothetical protein
MTRFTAHFDVAHNYILQYTITHTSVDSHVLLPLLGSGFHWQTFPFLWVPELIPASSTSF